MASKTLSFYSSGLQRDTTVMLMFDPPPSMKLFRTMFPVVWKVITFRAQGHGKASVIYVPRYAFGYAQTDADNLVNVPFWKEVESGDIASVSGGPGAEHFGENSKDDNSKLLVCKNNTEAPANFSIGTLNGERYEPALLWTDIGVGSEVLAQFVPTLTAYITRDYKASELLRGEVESEAIWQAELNELDDATAWQLVEDAETGEFSIVASTSV
ncbi:hypothetical protein BDV93DRAFT_261243 [Ceratobasidium sp. AG-I]|nr:hypothetical protein BDV93DRAFT_261243 [Ceratobasidium sp. AG-I]